MTVPLLILAAFAAFAGIFNAGPLHFTPMEHWLEPVFESSNQFVTTIKAGEELRHLEHLLLIPGILAFLIGAGLAYWVYQVKKGEPARKLVEALPRLHRLVYEKWRIDELYDVTVIGALESLAEVSALFDKYIIDGILARTIAAIVAIMGSLLRVFQTGKIQVYALAMVFGLIAVSAQVVFAHGRAQVSQDEKTGDFRVEATPGLGYRYRWDLDNDGRWDSGDNWTDQRIAPLARDNQPNPGETKVIRLQVQNAFKMTSTKQVTLSRPQPDLSAPAPMGMNAGDSAGRGVAQ
jgi:NADH-quinone oxidoreductase subunit L